MISCCNSDVRLCDFFAGKWTGVCVWASVKAEMHDYMHTWCTKYLNNITISLYIHTQILKTTIIMNVIILKYTLNDHSLITWCSLSFSSVNFYFLLYLILKAFLLLVPSCFLFQVTLKRSLLIKRRCLIVCHDRNTVSRFSPWSVTFLLLIHSNTDVLNIVYSLLPHQPPVQLTWRTWPIWMNRDMLHSALRCAWRAKAT